MGVEDFIGGGKYDKRATCVIEIYEQQDTCEERTKG